MPWTLSTVTSLTFSLVLVTLQLASSQFSPRLLRTFVRDRFVQRTLALFLATFTYALTVLRAVRDDQEFVPKISVTVSFTLTMLSVIVLVLFLGHVVREIRPETMLRKVFADGLTTARKLPSRDDGEDPPRASLRQDRDVAAGGPGQARRRFREPAPSLTVAIRGAAR